MSIRISSRNRTFSNGVAVGEKLRPLIIDKLLILTASSSEGKLPRRSFSFVAKDLCLSNPTVSKIWRYYILNKTVVPTRFHQGCRILSQEDEEYIRQLVLMKPTLYKKEIRCLLLQNTNTPIQHVSMTTIFDTVQHRISSKQFTYKKSQHSNKNWWTPCNLYYTRNFLNFIYSVNPYTVRFVDEASVNYSMSYRLYGAAESGSRAFDVSTHKQDKNYTIFVLVCLNDLCYVECELAPTDGIGFINFIHRACTAFNNNGERIVHLEL